MWGSTCSKFAQVHARICEKSAWEDPRLWTMGTLVQKHTFIRQILTVGRFIEIEKYCSLLWSSQTYLSSPGCSASVGLLYLKFSEFRTKYFSWTEIRAGGGGVLSCRESQSFLRRSRNILVQEIHVELGWSIEQSVHRTNKIHVLQYRVPIQQVFGTLP